MEELLCKVFEEVYEQEFSQYKTNKKHFFSFRHRRMMKKLFRDYKNKSVVTETPQTGSRPKRKLSATAIVAITVSILLSITAAAIAIYSFGFIKQKDHTIAFSENVEKSPATIEYLYVIDPLPDGYTEKEKNEGHIYTDVHYSNQENYFILTQKIKKKYVCRYNTEGYEIEKLDVNGHDGFFIKLKDDSFLVWDNGDYVLELYGTLDKDELLNLSKYTKIQRIENLS